MPATDELLSALFDDPNAPLYTEFEGWLASRKFTNFAAVHQAKLRDRLKKARGDENLKDARAELQTAVLLMRDERFKLDYDAYSAIDVRGPDFTVTFRGNMFFNVEVRRVRSDELGGAAEALRDRLMAMLCIRIKKMPPKIANLLWLTPDGELSESDVSSAALALRQRAEDKDEAYFTERGFESAAEFLKQYRLLSGIVLHRADANVIWLNELARTPVPQPVVKALQSLRAD